MAHLDEAPLAGRAPQISHFVRCGWFWAWVVVGALGALGSVSLGPLALGPALIVAALMAGSRTARQSAFGLATGAGLLLLFVAYLQREGPGTTCWHTATSGGCDEHLNPLPWLVVGLALVVGGFVGETRHNA